MERFIPREKLSKRRKKELNAQKRSTWEGINPVTRKLESKKLYSRKRTPYMDERPSGVFLFQEASFSFTVPLRFCYSSSSAR